MNRTRRWAVTRPRESGALRPTGRQTRCAFLCTASQLVREHRRKRALGTTPWPQTLHLMTPPPERYPAARSDRPIRAARHCSVRYPMIESDAMQAPLDLQALQANHESALLGFAGRLCGSLGDAEDLVQTLWLRVGRTETRPQPGAERAWLLSIMKNLWKDSLRHRQRRLALVNASDLRNPTGDEGDLNFEPPDSREPDPPARLEQFERAEALWDCLRRLESQLREALVPFVFEGECYEDISGTLRIPRGTVASRISRAKAKLEDCMRRKGWI